jgi:hypothetical protein
MSEVAHMQAESPPRLPAHDFLGLTEGHILRLPNVVPT